MVAHVLNKIGWKFDNSYSQLPDKFYTRENPTLAKNPHIIVLNHKLAQELGISLNEESNPSLASFFCGNHLPDGAQPLAQAYAGHQFGYFTMLGDGRAHLIGEHITPNDARVDIQLKGSGRTAYSRSGDGRAALGPMLREYIISEAMHALNIPTTRSLAVVTTGEPVMRETMLQGAVLTRVASSHLRVGTFEYLAAHEDIEGLKELADYAINRHYPELKETAEPYLEFLKSVMKRHMNLTIEWLRVGFIHGVMNSDNATISGETIDYGPCAFMDNYHPDTVFNSIDQNKRYAFANQPHITQWNLARLAESLLPLLHTDIAQAVALAEETIKSFNAPLQAAWLNMMRRKLGLFGEDEDDGALAGDFLKWMQHHDADYTLSFRDIISETIPKAEHYQNDEFSQWWDKWQQRLKQNSKPLKSSFCLMRVNNPAIIARNHKVEEALSAAEEHGDFIRLNALLTALEKPYEDNAEFADYQQPPKREERVLQTFCGT